MKVKDINLMSVLIKVTSSFLYQYPVPPHQYQIITRCDNEQFIISYVVASSWDIKKKLNLRFYEFSLALFEKAWDGLDKNCN